MHLLVGRRVFKYSCTNDSAHANNLTLGFVCVEYLLDDGPSRRRNITLSVQLCPLLTMGEYMMAPKKKA